MNRSTKAEQISSKQESTKTECERSKSRPILFIVCTNKKNSSTSTSTNSSNNIVGGTIFTAKQQQQLDRNAFLLTLTKDQLKVECRKRGQKTNGTKTELVYCGFFSLPRPKSHTIFPNALHRNIRQFLFFFVGLYVIVCRLKFFLLYSRRNLSRWDKKFRCLDVFLFFSVFIVNDLSLDNNFIFL